MFLDSCVLNELSLNSETSDLIENAGQYFSTFVSAISLLEVGFGPRNKADKEQQELAINLYTNKNIIKAYGSTIDQIDPITSEKSGKKFLYIPEEHEWFGARHNLIEWMDREGAGGGLCKKAVQ